MHWFRNEISRAYKIMNDKHDDEINKLVLKIARNNGRITVRELMQTNSRKYPSKDKAEEALCELKQHGIGNWIGMNTYSFDPDGTVDRVSDTDYAEPSTF